MSDLRLPRRTGDTLERLRDRLTNRSNYGTTSAWPLWEWRLLQCGLSGAIVRYKAACARNTALDARVSVGEALWWISAADEFLRKKVCDLGRDRDKALYYQEIGSTDSGRALSGLVYARNTAGHELTLLLRAAAVSPPDEDQPLTADVVRAMRRVVMAPDEGVPDGGYVFSPLTHGDFFHRDECYSSDVAGRNVLEVLTGVEQRLKQVLVVPGDAGGELIFTIDPDVFSPPLADGGVINAGLIWIERPSAEPV